MTGIGLSARRLRWYSATRRKRRPGHTARNYHLPRKPRRVRAGQTHQRGASDREQVEEYPHLSLPHKRRSPVQWKDHRLVGSYRAWDPLRRSADQEVALGLAGSDAQELRDHRRICPCGSASGEKNGWLTVIVLTAIAGLAVLSISMTLFLMMTGSVTSPRRATRTLGSGWHWKSHDDGR